MAKKSDKKIYAEQAREEAIAAGATKKEVNQAVKAATQEFAKTTQQAKSAQKAEINALKNFGADSSVIKAEKSANQEEIKRIQSDIAAGVSSPLTYEQLTGFRSAASNYDGQLRDQVFSLLDDASAYYTQFNIPTLYQKGNATTGFGLNQLVNYQTQLNNGIQPTGLVAKAIDRAQNFVGNSFTADDLIAAGVKQQKLKPVEGSDGLFQWTSGGDNKITTYFRQNPDGTFTGSGISPTRVDTSGGSFLGLGDIGGALALGALGFFAGPALAGLGGFTGGAAGAVGGALTGAGASALAGYDPIKGALAAGTGGYLGGSGGFGSLLGGTQAPAPIVDATYAAGAPTVPGLTASMPTIPGSAPIFSGGGTTTMGPTGVPITDISIPYDPNYVEPSLGSSLKNLGSAVGETVKSGMGTKNLLSAGQSLLGLAQPQVPLSAYSQPVMAGGQRGPVDYSGILGLLNPRQVQTLNLFS